MKITAPNITPGDYSPQGFVVSSENEGGVAVCRNPSDARFLAASKKMAEALYNAYFRAVFDARRGQLCRSDDAADIRTALEAAGYTFED